MTQTCPKCRRPAEENGPAACPRCGLLRSRWASYEEQMQQPHPVLDPLWRHAQEDWQDEARHRALASLVTSDWSLLSVLAGRYNQVLRQRPDDAVAQRALDQLIQVAMRLPPPVKKGAERAGVQGTRAAVGALLLLLSVYLFFLLWRRMG
jgi:hypothetical protein